MENKTYRYRGQKLTVKRNSYANNGTLAVCLCNLDGSLYDVITTNLNHFNIYRNMLVTKEAELIAEVPYTGESNYAYYDSVEEIGDYEYSVTCVFVRGDEQCESEMVNIGGIIVTAIDENSANVNLYPNPTEGLLNVTGQGTMYISVSNLLGQKLMEIHAEDNTVLDLGQFGQGIYLIRVATDSGVTVQKVNVK